MAKSTTKKTSEIYKATAAECAACADCIDAAELQNIADLPLTDGLPSNLVFDAENNPYFMPGNTNATNLILRLDAYLQVTPDARLTPSEITILSKIVYRQLSKVERQPNIHKCPFAGAH